MSLSPFNSFQSQFVTYLLNFPRIILYTAVLWVMTPSILVAWYMVTNVLEEPAGCTFSVQEFEAVNKVKIRVLSVACNCILEPWYI